MSYYHFTQHLHQILLKCSFGLLSTCPKNPLKARRLRRIFRQTNQLMTVEVRIHLYVRIYVSIYIYILPTFRVFFFLLTSRGLQPGSFQVKFVWLENSQFSKAEMIFSPILNPTILDCERCNPDFFPPTLANAMFTKKR